MRSIALYGKSAFCAAMVFYTAFSAPIGAQNTATRQKLLGTISIGDAVQQTNHPESPKIGSPRIPMVATPTAANPEAHVHLIYVHGIYEEGPKDSALLRSGMCKYLKECNFPPPTRIYAEGPFALGTPRPKLEYMGQPIWKTQEEWYASAPFIDRYLISGTGNLKPIVLDEVNWYPLAYPLKCKFLVRQEASLAGTTDAEMNACSVPNAKTSVGDLDPDHQGRYIDFRWISETEAKELRAKRHRVPVANRILKAGLMDFGFSDAVMALGPMHEILCAAIRELMVASVTGDGVDLSGPPPADGQHNIYFVTHSLGSYLSLEAMDPELLGNNDGLLPDFQPTELQKHGADYFAAHTTGFYFLANQIELLELARITLIPDIPTGALPCAAGLTAPTQTGSSTGAAILHWRCMRQDQAAETGESKRTQIIAWSDPSDLLSWEVGECLAGARVVNLPVSNKAGFRIPWLLAWPSGVHANYARNPAVLRVIFKPSSSNDHTDEGVCNSEKP